MNAALSFGAALLFLLVASATARAADDPKLLPGGPLNERQLLLQGDPSRPVTLEVTLFSPPGPGPFPLAVMNHGANEVSATNRGPRYRLTFSAYYFLSRGYAVALPMARGFAGSGGNVVVQGCALDEVGLANARDLRAVIEQLVQIPGIDRNRVVVAGQSFGGWTSLAFASFAVSGVHGVVAFMPALRASDCRSQDDAMVNSAGRLGKQAKSPTLWFYGDNDTILPTPVWHRIFSAYRDSGARTDLVEIGPFMKDSHQMLGFPESLPIWTPKVDAFLNTIGLPSAETYPEYLPLVSPPPTHGADISQIADVPYLNDKGRTAYQAFLAAGFPRVFAIAPDGTFSVSNGGFDPLARALQACRSIGHECHPYAIDADVVWAEPPVRPTVVARTVMSGTTVPLNFAYALNPDCSSRGSPKLLVSHLPSHGVTTIATGVGHPNFPAPNRFATCNATLVTGTTTTYASAPGFTGPDVLTLDETDIDGRHHVYRIELTVR